MQQISGDAWRIYFANLPALLGLALTTVPIQMLVGTIQDQVGSKDAQANLIGFLLLPSLVVSMVSSSAVISAANAAIVGGRADFGAAIDAAFARLGGILSSFLLAIALTLASLVGIPYFAVRWTFQGQGVMIEGKRNWAALDASSAIVKGHWWRTFGVLLFLFVPIFPIAIMQGAPWAQGLIPLTLLGLAFAALIPYVLTAQTLLYYDLKARTEPDVSADRLPPPE
jgi:hypothetical protein